MKHQKFQSGCSLSMITSCAARGAKAPGAGLFLRAAAAGGKVVNRSITNTRWRVYGLRSTPPDLNRRNPQQHPFIARIVGSRSPERVTRPGELTLRRLLDALPGRNGNGGSPRRPGEPDHLPPVP